MPTLSRIPDHPERVLGVWAHPDDEAYLSATLMAETIDRGGHVTVVAVTDGEGGFAADDPRSPVERAAVRRAELRRAMAEIGVTDVRFLSFPDGRLADYPVSAAAARIADVMAEVGPDVTVTFGPDGITGHRDHVAAGLATTLAWARTRPGRLWYAATTVDWLDEWRALHDRFEVWMTEEPAGIESDRVEHSVAATGAALDRKRRVLAAHASQTDAVAEAVGEVAYRGWIADETFRSPTVDELVAAAGAAALGTRWVAPVRATSSTRPRSAPPVATAA